MLTGKSFRFHRPVTGIHLLNGTASVVTIKTGETVKVLSGPNANGKLHDQGLVYVQWEQYTIALFAVDLEARGTETDAEREQRAAQRQSASA